MHQRGAVFTARTPLMKDLVAEITGAGADAMLQPMHEPAPGVTR
jgi:hypothetical protein